MQSSIQVLHCLKATFDWERFTFSIFYRHRAAVHCVLPGNLRPLWKAVHLGCEVVRDGERCAAGLSNYSGHFGAPHDGWRTPGWKQADTRKDLSLCEADARYAWFATPFSSSAHTSASHWQTRNGFVHQGKVFFPVENVTCVVLHCKANWVWLGWSVSVLIAILDL